MTRVVAVLSGGGAKAAAQVGALRALADAGHEPAHYVGTSMGAVVAAAYASGLKYEDLVERMTSITRRDIASPAAGLLLGPWAGSLFRRKPLMETIAALVDADSFDELRYPLTVTAVDAASGELRLFGHGGRRDVPLVDALYASCALPVYYPPAEIGGRFYFDGGLRAVLPLDTALRFEPDWIFAVMVGPTLFSEQISQRSSGLLHSYNTAIRVLMGGQTEDTIADWKRSTPCRLSLVWPRVFPTATFALERVVSFIEEGYRAAVRELSLQDTDE